MGITYASYLEATAARIHESAFAGIDSREDWEAPRSALRSEFLTSMGFSGSPSTDNPSITKLDSYAGDGYAAAALSYEIVPGCYGSGMAVYPDPLLEGPGPGVLYLCGHANFGIEAFHPHAIMWARRGYVCLIVDTIRQSDNPGEHLGLRMHDRWDWISLGYSAAGGEFLNSTRALDVLLSLPEVDRHRVGVTGFSGGGAHSFFLGIADERVRAVGSLCGVGNLHRMISDRQFQPHCQCMHVSNPYQRDTAEFGALIAPRPLLLCYATGDTLFSSEEYTSLHDDLRRIYGLFDHEERCRLLTFAGPHEYHPDAVEAVNAWFDEHVAGRSMPAAHLGGQELTERQCSVFNGAIPVPDRLDILPELLTPPVALELPDSVEGLRIMREPLLEQLRDTVFRGVLRSWETLQVQRQVEVVEGQDANAARTTRCRATIGGMELNITHRIPAGGANDMVIHLWAPAGEISGLSPELPLGDANPEYLLIEPRASGLDSIGPAAAKHLARAGILVGVSPIALWVRDLLAVVDMFRQQGKLDGKRILLVAADEAATAALYTALLEPAIDAVVLSDLIYTHKIGGIVPGILKVMDVKHALGLLAPRVIGLDTTEWNFGFWATRLYERLGIRERFVHTHFLARTMDLVLQQMARKAATPRVSP